MTFHSGQQIDIYTLISPLGRGGFAEVWLAQHKHLHTLVAIKILQSEAEQSEIPQEAFYREARMIGSLKHSHIIDVRDARIVDVHDARIDEQNKLAFLVMEYIAGGSLRKKHPRGTRLPLATIQAYVKQIAGALQYAHDSGVVHRDVKPDNILLVDNDGNVKLCDFGIAAIIDSTQAQSTRSNPGTAAYMPEEQRQGRPQFASDQYALALTACEWLTGQAPLDILYPRTAEGKPPSLLTHVPELPKAVEEVLFIALDNDPQKRFVTVRAFAQALEQAIATPSAARPTPPPQSPIRPPAPGQTRVLPSPSLGEMPPLESFVKPPLPAPAPMPPPKPSRMGSGVPHFEDELPLSIMPLQPNNIPGAPPVGPPPDSRRAPTPIRLGSPKPSGDPHGKNDSSGKIPVLPLPLGVAPAMSPPLSSANAAAASIATPSTPGTAQRQVGLTPLPPPISRRHRSRGPRRLLLAALLILITLLVGGLIVNALGGLNGLASLGHLSATVTLTPRSQLVQNNYLFTGVLSPAVPDAAHHEIAARQLDPQVSTKQANGQATGSVGGAKAHGILVFQNVGTTTVTLGTTTLIATGGVQIQFVGPVTVPAGGSSTATTTGYAVNVGAAGNIGTFAIDRQCCAATIFVKNNTAFVGGVDPYLAVTQNDVATAAAPLITQLKAGMPAALKKQVKSGEQIVNDS
ncbi:MAG TPA: serine/threonine-protein kinase, partial [Ktedonobacteraceae bacterium]